MNSTYANLDSVFVDYDKKEVTCLKCKKFSFQYDSHTVTSVYIIQTILDHRKSGACDMREQAQSFWIVIIDGIPSPFNPYKYVSLSEAESAAESYANKYPEHNVHVLKSVLTCVKDQQSDYLDKVAKQCMVDATIDGIFHRITSIKLLRDRADLGLREAIELIDKIQGEKYHWRPL